MPGIVNTYTNKEWANLGHDLVFYQLAYYDYTYHGSGAHCAAFAERFDEIKYVLDVPPQDIAARVESYGLDRYMVVILGLFDWAALADEWRDENADE